MVIISTFEESWLTGRARFHLGTRLIVDAGMIPRTTEMVHRFSCTALRQCLPPLGSRRAGYMYAGRKKGGGVSAWCECRVHECVSYCACIAPQSCRSHLRHPQEVFKHNHSSFPQLSFCFFYQQGPGGGVALSERCNPVEGQHV